MEFSITYIGNNEYIYRPKLDVKKPGFRYRHFYATPQTLAQIVLSIAEHDELVEKHHGELTEQENDWWIKTLASDIRSTVFSFNKNTLFVYDFDSEDGTCELYIVYDVTSKVDAINEALSQMNNKVQLCSKCERPAIFGTGSHALCYDHLDPRVQGSDYRDYHTPVDSPDHTEVSEWKANQQLSLWDEESDTVSMQHKGLWRRL